MPVGLLLCRTGRRKGAQTPLHVLPLPQVMRPFRGELLDDEPVLRVQRQTAQILLTDFGEQEPPSKPFENSEQAGELNPTEEHRREPVLADHDAAVIVEP